MVTAVDYFTKWVEAEAIPAKMGVHVAKFLYHLQCRYGVAWIALMDQGLYTFKTDRSFCFGVVKCSLCRTKTTITCANPLTESY